MSTVDRVDVPHYTCFIMTNEKLNQGARTCSQCGAGFTCGLAAGAERCWCFDLPVVLPAREGAACLCPKCLQAVLDEALLIKTENISAE